VEILKILILSKVEVLEIVKLSKRFWEFLKFSHQKRRF